MSPFYILIVKKIIKIEKIKLKNKNANGYIYKKKYLSEGSYNLVRIQYKSSHFLYNIQINFSVCWTRYNIDN